MNDMKLSESFFARSTLEVAKDLIGKKIYVFGHEGIITETEAYRGEGDPACHGSNGLTLRNQVLFGAPGYAYVYLIYGMYYCLNFVTERANFAAGVLVRGIYLTEPEKLHLNGPGKVCRYLGITTAHNGIKVVDNDLFYIEDQKLQLPHDITPRIGLSKGNDLLWRFVVSKSTLKSHFS